MQIVGRRHVTVHEIKNFVSLTVANILQRRSVLAYQMVS